LIWDGLIFLSLSLSSLCVIYHWRRSFCIKTQKVFLSLSSLCGSTPRGKSYSLNNKGWGLGGRWYHGTMFTIYTQKYTPEYLTWWKYFINGSTLHSLFWNHWWDTWLVGFLIRVIMLQTLIHKSVWILFKIIDKVPCSQYTHKNTHLNIWLDGSISLLVLRCILCSEIIGGILG